VSTTAPTKSRRKPKQVVKYLAPVDPQLQVMGKVQLLELSYQGHDQTVRVGLELLRRAQKRALAATNGEAS